MFNKINKEIDDFTKTIKEIKGCDEMLTYMNSNIYASIKLIMFASKTFASYSKIVLFFIISLTGLLAMSFISTGVLNIGLLVITLVLFFLILVYVMHFKKALIFNIKNKKSLMKKDEQ